MKENQFDTISEFVLDCKRQTDLYGNVVTQDGKIIVYNVANELILINHERAMGRGGQT